MNSVDRISELPENITDHILQFLTLKDAARTSVLSTRWRYKWTPFPQLILDHSFFGSVIKKFDSMKLSCECKGSLDGRIHKYTNIVNNILNPPHHGPIHKFVLYLPRWFPVEEDISHWIRSLSTKSVHELTLIHGWLLLRRRLPSSMFSCVRFDRLTRLTLIDMTLPSLSTTCSGFPSLITFQAITGNDADGVGNLVSKCPLLDNLYLVIYDQNGRLNINAPRLQNLVVKGGLNSVLLFKEETERIKTLSLLCHLDDNGIKQTSELFYCCPFIDTLVLSTDCWQALDMSIVGDCCFERLKSATIFIESSCDSVSYGIALEVIQKILSSSPVLEVMTIVTAGLSVENMNLAQEFLRHRHTTTPEIIFNTCPIDAEIPIHEPPQWSKYVNQRSYIVS